ncbi:MAG: aldo/keto reductase [Bacilli bacterium]|nr:aldo/keto reductase [Bacilli bacterium]
MDKELSKVALGCDIAPFHKGLDIAPIMDECRKQGINVFDSARGYGKSEQVLGEYIRNHGERGDYFVISKGCFPYVFAPVNAKILKRDLETSLVTLDIGYIDLYLIHHHSKNADAESVLEVLHDYQRQGKIRHYGLSNWELPFVKQFNELAKQKGYDPAFCVSNAYSLIPWHKKPWGELGGHVCTTGNQEEIEYYSSTGTMFLAYSPMARGFLSGRVKADDPKTFSWLSLSGKRANLCPANIERLRRIEKIAERLQLSVPSLTIAYLTHSKLGAIPVLVTTKPSRLAGIVEASKIDLGIETMAELDAIIAGTGILHGDQD